MFGDEGISEQVLDLRNDGLTLAGLPELPDLVKTVCDNEKQRKHSRRPTWTEFIREVKSRGIVTTEETAQRAWSNIPSWTCSRDQVENAIQSVVFHERSNTRRTVVVGDASTRIFLPSMETPEASAEISIDVARLPSHLRPRSSSSTADDSFLTTPAPTSASTIDF